MCNPFVSLQETAGIVPSMASLWKHVDSDEANWDVS